MLLLFLLLLEVKVVVVIVVVLGDVVPDGCLSREVYGMVEVIVVVWDGVVVEVVVPVLWYNC